MARIKKGYIVRVMDNPELPPQKVYIVRYGQPYPYYCGPVDAKDEDPLTPYKANELEIVKE